MVAFIVVDFMCICAHNQRARKEYGERWLSVLLRFLFLVAVLAYARRLCLKLTVDDSLLSAGILVGLLNDLRFRIPVFIVAQPIGYARRHFRFTASVVIAFPIHCCCSNCTFNSLLRFVIAL